MRSLTLTLLSVCCLSVCCLSVSADEQCPRKNPLPHSDVVCIGEALSHSCPAATPVAGHLRAIDEVLTQSIANLKRNNLEGVVEAAQNLVVAMDGTSADLQKTFRTSGRTLAQLEHGLRLLQNTSSDSGSQNGDADALEGVRRLRDELLGELRKVHADHQRDTSPSSGNAMVRMQQLVDRIRSLDEVIGASEDSADLAESRESLLRNTEAAIETVKAEQRVLEAQSAALAVVVRQSFQALSDSVDLRELREQFPDEQIETLVSARHNLSELAALSAAANEAAERLGNEGVLTSPADKASDSDAHLLARVRQLLK